MNEVGGFAALFTGRNSVFLRKLFKLLKTVFKCAVTLGIVAALFIALSNIIVIAGANDSIVTVEDAAEKKADCIIVLGCSVYGNTPSPMLKDRLLTAVELYKAGAAPKILMSGDHQGQYYNEVMTMKKFAIECGVPSEDIFLDHYGLSTYESMYRADAIFELKSAIVVTQGYHLSRSVYVAERFGINTMGVQCEDIKYSNQIYRDLREICARTKDFAYCIFKPEPKYLGDVIPVTGNGDATNERPS